MSLQNQFELMARYNQWMNQKIYHCCSELSDDQRKTDMGAYFGSIHATLNHILVADHIWLSRFRQKKPPYRLGEEIAGEFTQLRQARESMDNTLLEWSKQLSTSWLRSDIVYTSGIDKKTRAIPAWVLITHMFNHQTHHRGQVTTLLSQLQVDPGVTDIPWMPEFNSI